MMQLTERERNLLIGGAFLLAAGGIFWGVQSLLGWFDTIQSEKTTILNSRQEIESYGKEYNLLKDLAEQVGSKTQQKDITPVIEELLNSNQLREKAVSVNPSKTTIENKYTKYLVSISLKNVSANEFLSFIKSVENYPGAFLKVDYFSSRPILRKPGLYTCQIKVATFTKKS